LRENDNGVRNKNVCILPGGAAEEGDGQTYGVTPSPVPTDEPPDDDSATTPILPPRLSKLSLTVSTPSPGDSDYCGKDPYEAQNPTFDVVFHVGVGQMYKFNPDTDKVVLCLGTKPRKMTLDK
jgi:hypothetical protein